MDKLIKDEFKFSQNAASFKNVYETRNVKPDVFRNCFISIRSVPEWPGKFLYFIPDEIFILFGKRTETSKDQKDSLKSISSYGVKSWAVLKRYDLLFAIRIFDQIKLDKINTFFLEKFKFCSVKWNTLCILNNVVMLMYRVLIRKSRILRLKITIGWLNMYRRHPVYYWLLLSISSVFHILESISNPNVLLSKNHMTLC